MAEPTVAVSPVTPEHRRTLVALMQLYLHDLSSVEAWDVDEWGSFGDDDLDGCWDDPARHPFAISVDGVVAGFAIIDEWADDTSSGRVWDVAEYFVLRRWRRRGVGLSAARLLAERFPGRWQVRPFPGYPPAMEFWSVAASALASGAVSRSTFERRGKHHPMLTFDVGQPLVRAATASAALR